MNRPRLSQRVLAWSTGVVLAVALVVFPVAPAQAALGAWSQVGLGGVPIGSVAVDPTNASILFAGSLGQGIFRSTNQAQSFSAVNNGLGNLFVNDLAINPANTSVVLAGTGQGAAVGDPGSGIYRTTNRGDSWTMVAEGFVASIAFDPRNPQIVYAGGGPAVQKSTNGGVTWNLSFATNAPIANLDVRGISVNPQNSNIILAAGTTEGGTGQVFRSTDAGANWNLIIGENPPIFDVVFQSGTVAFYAGQNGVFRSTDGGLTWALVTEELGNVTVFRLLVNPVNPSQVFAGTSGRGVVQTNDGLNWSFLDTTLGNAIVRGLDIDRTTPQTLYAGANNGVFAFTFAPPPFTPTTTWFFGEGSSQPPFDTWFLVQNPTAQTANVRFTFQLQGGGTVSRSFVVGPTSRFSVFSNQVIPNQAFSTRIDADQPVFAERAQFVSFDGTAVTGIHSPSQVWLFGEGSTQNPFHTWLLLQNPNDQTTLATITYLLENGTTQTQGLSLPPLSRTSVFVNQVLPNAAFSTRIQSDLPIVAERSMFRFPGNAATGVSGVNAPATGWFFAEGGLTQQGRAADTWVLIQNPNNFAVNAVITLFDTAGNVQTIERTLPATSRQSFFLNQLTNLSSFGIRVEASAPVIAERSVFLGPEPRAAYATQGASTLSTVWNLAEGSTAPPFTEVVAVLNPNNSSIIANFEFFLEGGQVVTRQFTIGPNRKFSLTVDDIIPNAAVSTRVTTSLPTVVERTLFLAKLGNLGATNTIGIQP